MTTHAMASRQAPLRGGSAARGSSSHAAADRSPRSERARLLELQRDAGNRAVIALLGMTLQRAGAGAHGDNDADARPTPTPEHVTGYLGLNPAARKEADALRGASRERVLVSLNDPAAEEQLREDPAVFDLVDELGISPGDDYNRWDRATDILLKADPNLREQLADLMRWFSSADRGDTVLDRLVLSGHSNGVELWGDAGVSDKSKPGTMMIDRELSALATVFPKAAGQVQDIMFSACFSIAAVELVIRTFPNLRNCWSYSAYSPDIAGGSGDHIATFAGATEGEGALEKRDKRGSSAMWTREKGYIVGDPAAAAVGPLYTEVVGGWRALVQPMFQGERDVPKSSLDPFYAKIQELAAHPGATKDQRQAASDARDVVLRLRFWNTVRQKFGDTYGSELQPAYEALGVRSPEWATLTRVGLKAHLAELDKAIETHPDQAAARQVLERLVRKGLFGLDQDIILSGWI